MEIFFNNLDELASGVNLALDRENKIPQIKFLRSICPELGLKEAKDIIDKRAMARNVDILLAEMEKMASLQVLHSTRWTTDQQIRYQALIRRLANV